MSKLVKVVLFGLVLVVGMTACKKTEEASAPATEAVAPVANEVPLNTVEPVPAAAVEAKEVAEDAVQAAKDAAAAEASK